MRITQYPPHLQSEVWQIFWVTFGSHTAKWPKPLPHKMLSKVWQNHEKIAIYWRQGMPPSEKIRSHNPEVGGSSPPSATKSVTVVDTISTTVTFYLLPFGVCIWNEIRNIPNIFSHKQILCPELLQPWAEKTGLGTTEIVIRIETINYYFLYI